MAINLAAGSPGSVCRGTECRAPTILFQSRNVSALEVIKVEEQLFEIPKRLGEDVDVQNSITHAADARFAKDRSERQR